MRTYTLHTSHFSTELGAAKARTEAYTWYVEEVLEASDNAMQKERWQSFGLCPKAGQRGAGCVG